MEHSLIGVRTKKYKCNSGYILSSDNSQCIPFADATKDDGSTSVKAQHYGDAQYGWDGVIFYKSGNVNIDGTWDKNADQSLLPDIWSRNPQSFFPYANYTSYTSGIFIKPFDIHDTTSGIMNACSIWKQGEQDYVGTLGFSRTITIPAESTSRSVAVPKYYLGFGVDNYCTIKVNGATILQQDVEKIEGIGYLPHSVGSNYDSSSVYTYWQVIPIDLVAGQDNIIEILATNTSSPGAIATQIYNATLDDIQACTTLDELEAITIFSTGDVANGDSFDLGSWKCEDGWTLDYENSYPICKKLDEAVSSIIYQ